VIYVISLLRDLVCVCVVKRLKFRLLANSLVFGVLNAWYIDWLLIKNP